MVEMRAGASRRLNIILVHFLFSRGCSGSLYPAIAAVCDHIEEKEKEKDFGQIGSPSSSLGYILVGQDKE